MIFRFSNGTAKIHLATTVVIEADSIEDAETLYVEQLFTTGTVRTFSADVEMEIERRVCEHRVFSTHGETE